jgi:hypothetical protein
VEAVDSILEEVQNQQESCGKEPAKLSFSPRACPSSGPLISCRIGLPVLTLLATYFE